MLTNILFCFKVGQKIGHPLAMASDGSVNSENLPNNPVHVAKRAGDDSGAQPPQKKPLQVKKLFEKVALSFQILWVPLNRITDNVITRIKLSV